MFLVLDRYTIGGAQHAWQPAALEHGREAWAFDERIPGPRTGPPRRLHLPPPVTRYGLPYFPYPRPPPRPRKTVLRLRGTVRYTSQDVSRKPPEQGCELLTTKDVRDTEEYNRDNQ